MIFLIIQNTTKISKSISYHQLIMYQHLELEKLFPISCSNLLNNLYFIAGLKQTCEVGKFKQYSSISMYHLSKSDDWMIFFKTSSIITTIEFLFK